MKTGINMLLWTSNANLSKHERILDDIKRWGYDGC